MSHTAAETIDVHNKSLSEGLVPNRSQQRKWISRGFKGHTKRAQDKRERGGEREGERRSERELAQLAVRESVSFEISPFQVLAS